MSRVERAHWLKRETSTTVRTLSFSICFNQVSDIFLKYLANERKKKRKFANQKKTFIS